MLKRVIIPFVVSLAFASTGVAAEDQELAALFAQQNVKGAIVISSLRSGETFIHNEPRARQRFTVASTFKILNALIALEEKVISSKDDVFRWDGHLYSIPDWNRDQTLESAFKVSCVWCFQQLARKVGVERYRNYLVRCGYGELHGPFPETTFWLDGSLQISATEQVDFLKKIYQRSLPFSAPAYETLGQIMIVERTPAFTLRAKTGLAGNSQPQVGWYVGYVETSKDIWFFATNLEIRDDNELPLRQKVTREALEAKGVFK